MALKKAFCPNCGEATQIDDTKEFCFCLSCGNKIQVPRRRGARTEYNEIASELESKQGIQENINKNLQDQMNLMESQKINEDKMKEADFYYSLSQEKKEYKDLDKEPKYYLKGQDLLVDLSQQFPLNYRIWWELCKPMDFAIVLSGEKSNNPCTINSIYFDKALNLAPLDKKMELVRQHDKYVSVKNKILEEILAEQKAKEAEERVRNEERLRKERELEEERQRQEQLRKQKELEKQERDRAEQELKIMQLEQARVQRNVILWSALRSKDYSSIDNSYFQFSSPEKIIIIGTLKVVANVLYLSAYHIEEKKNKQAYLDQSLAIHFGSDGAVLKFDNKPVIVRGWDLSNSNMKVLTNLNGENTVNDIILYRDLAFVANISKNAKKPLIAFKKIFN